MVEHVESQVKPVRSDVGTVRSKIFRAEAERLLDQDPQSNAATIKRLLSDADTIDADQRQADKDADTAFKKLKDDCTSNSEHGKPQ